MDIKPTLPSMAILRDWGPMPPRPLHLAALTPRSPVLTCTSPSSQGRFKISPSDNLGGQFGGVFQVRERVREGLLLMDTTWRGALQSLLTTQMRTRELINAAYFTNLALRDAFSLEMWGGATFDVDMRFLHECPRGRLETLR